MGAQYGRWKEYFWRDLFYLMDYVTLTEIFQIGDRKKKKKKKKKKKDMVKFVMMYHYFPNLGKHLQVTSF